MDDSTGSLWLQEFADSILVSFIPGFYKPTDGRPERKLITSDDPEHGLRLLDEPIEQTLQREREEGTWKQPS